MANQFKIEFYKLGRSALFWLLIIFNAAVGISAGYSWHEKRHVNDVMFPFMDAAMSSDSEIKGYKKKDQLGNHMRFYFTDDGTDWFCDMMIDFEGDSCYMYYAYCNKKKENKFISKFRKMYDSIEYKK